VTGPAVQGPGFSPRHLAVLRDIRDSVARLAAS
jgi:hypothetical protein